MSVKSSQVKSSQVKSSQVKSISGRIFAWLAATALAALGVSPLAYAQMKVGSNPTTLAADTNLQVEATSGAQVTVQKSTGNVGVRTTNPQNSLHISSAAVVNTLGIRTPVLNAATLGTDANGDIVTKTAACTCGDIKAGLQTADHGDWKLMNGTSYTGSCGTFAINANNSYLSQNGAALGTLSGNNTKAIAQNNLPKVNLTTTSNGAHQHFTMENLGLSGTGSRIVLNPSWSGNLGIAVAAQWDGGVGGVWFDGSVSNAGRAGTANVGATSSNGEHTHTAPLNDGVTQQAFDVRGRELSVNMFICVN